MRRTPVERRASPRERGLTLVEVMMAAALLAATALVLTATLAAGLALARSTGDSATASFELQNAMERVRATSFDSLSATFPEGASIPAYAGRALRGERVFVSYNPGGSLGAPGSVTNPVEVVVTIEWLDPRNAARRLRLATVRVR